MLIIFLLLLNMSNLNIQFGDNTNSNDGMVFGKWDEIVTKPMSKKQREKFKTETYNHWIDRKRSFDKYKEQHANDIVINRFHCSSSGHVIVTDALNS